MKNFVLNNAQKELANQYFSMVEIVIRSKFNINNNRIAAGYLVDDAIQDGAVALCNAAYHFDEKCNTSFKTYATTVIYNYICNQIKHHNAKISNDVCLDEAENSTTELQNNDSLVMHDVKEFIKKRKPVFEKKHPLAYDVFMYRIVYGKKMSDICSSLNIPKGSVYHFYNQAKEDFVCNYYQGGVNG